MRVKGSGPAEGEVHEGVAKLSLVYAGYKIPRHLIAASA